MSRLDTLARFIRSWEGGFVNDPRDRGGATNKGITIGTFRAVFGKDKSVTDLKNMTLQQWEYIFKKYFWNKWKADDIKDEWVAYLVVDWLWCSGSHGITKVQKYLGLNPDGVVGPKTISKINSLDSKLLFTNLWKLRESFIRGLRQFSTYGKGWLRRLNGIQYGKLCLNR